MKLYHQLKSQAKPNPLEIIMQNLICFFSSSAGYPTTLQRAKPWPTTEEGIWWWISTIPGARNLLFKGARHAGADRSKLHPHSPCDVPSVILDFWGYISPTKALFRTMFLLPRWDMLPSWPWRVHFYLGKPSRQKKHSEFPNFCGFFRGALRHFLCSFDINEAGSDPLKVRRPA